jgi:hypothetical protein
MMARPMSTAVIAIPAFAPVLRPLFDTGFGGVVVTTGRFGDVVDGRLLVVVEEAEEEVAEEEEELWVLLMLEVGLVAAAVVGVAPSLKIFAVGEPFSDTNVTPTGESGPVPLPLGASTSCAWQATGKDC